MLICQIEKRDNRLDASIVHQDVDRTKLFPHAVEHRLNLISLRDVRNGQHRTPAFAADLLHHSLRFRGCGLVVDRNIGAFFGKDFGDRPADPWPPPVTRATLLRSFLSMSSFRFLVGATSIAFFRGYF
jgi:hypothetical protein